MKDVIRCAGIFAVVFTALYLFVPQFLHRREFDRAIYAYTKNPNPETKAAFDREDAIYQREYIVIVMGEAAVITAAGCVLLVLVPRALRR